MIDLHICKMSLIRSCGSKDFVMYVGGHIWALDWCPRIHETPDYNNKCEVLLYILFLFLVYLNMLLFIGNLLGLSPMLFCAFI